MEFAVEAQALMRVSLEGSGRLMLHIENLTAVIAGQTDPPTGSTSRSTAARCTPSWGPTAPARAPWPTSSPAATATSSTGTVTFDGIDLLTLTPEDRAAAGLFLAFQYPIEIPGVGNMYFLRAALNAVRRRARPRRARRVDFLALAKEHMARLDMDPAFLSRSVNDGFSGGEKKRNEVLQMSMLEPRLADPRRDRLRARHRRPARRRRRASRTCGAPDRAMLIITHYPHLLELVQPDYVHVLRDGRIVRTGDRHLVQEIATDGFGPATAPVSVP